MWVITERTDILTWYAKWGFRQTGKLFQRVFLLNTDELVPFPMDGAAGLPKYGAELKFVVIRKSLVE